MIFLVLLRSGLPNPHPLWGSLSNWSLISGIVVVSCLIQIGYHYPHIRPELRNEAGITFWLSLGSIAFVIAFLLLKPGLDFFGPVLSVLILHVLAWLNLSIRQFYHYARLLQTTTWNKIGISSQEPVPLNVHTFGLLLFTPIPPAAVLIWNYFVPFEASQIELIMSGTLALVAFIGMYFIMNHLAEPTDLLYKLTFMSFLLLALMANGTAYFVSRIRTDYSPTIGVASGQRYHIQRQGDSSYHMQALPQECTIDDSCSIIFPNDSIADSISDSATDSATDAVIDAVIDAETALGTPLNIQDNGWQEIELDFTFPFFEHRWNKLKISDNGFLRQQGGGDMFGPGDYNAFPVIAPMLVDFVPKPGGNIYVARADDS